MESELMTHNTRDIVIRLLTTPTELEQVRQLECNIWGQREAVPYHQTLAFTKNGGLVLGAFTGSRLIGFLYSFPGYDGKSIYLYSHTLAVDSSFRSSGIGEKLKQAQREQSKKMGYSYIMWTYDPLESINGYLNIGKLKAVCSTYVEDCYGDLTDSLNTGLPTDRFLVTWSTVARKKITHDKQTLQQVLDANIVEWKLNDESIPVIQNIHSGSFIDKHFLAVAIPLSFQKIKDHSASIARDWRMKTRTLFTEYFESGWEITDFMKHPQEDFPVCFYIMTRKGKEHK